MADCENTTGGVNTIANALAAIGPRTAEGDQGRVTMHSVQDAIAAANYGNARDKMKNRHGIQSVLRTISGHRLLAHDGPAS